MTVLPPSELLHNSYKGPLAALAGGLSPRLPLSEDMRKYDAWLDIAGLQDCWAQHNRKQCGPGSRGHPLRNRTHMLERANPSESACGGNTRRFSRGGRLPRLHPGHRSDVHSSTRCRMWAGIAQSTPGFAPTQLYLTRNSDYAHYMLRLQRTPQVAPTSQHSTDGSIRITRWHATESARPSPQGIPDLLLDDPPACWTAIGVCHGAHRGRHAGRDSR